MIRRAEAEPQKADSAARGRSRYARMGGRAGLRGALCLPLLLLLCCLLLTGLARTESAFGQSVRDHEPILPLAVPAGLNPAKVNLGRRLFQDPLLSVDQTVSCASCHNLSTGGTDRRAASVGVRGAIGGIRAPTVYNSGYNVAQFWNGRAATLEEQVNGPLTATAEMASTWPLVLDRLTSNPDYLMAFKQIYGGPPNENMVRDAIASFERSLVTTDSRFDRWLRGDDAALTAEELQGYRLFKSYGCSSCHQGANVGGNVFTRLGLFEEWHPAAQRSHNGRMDVTHRPEDKGVFKVPSLRLAALNPPYFHDGSIPTLAEAVRLMGRLQLDRDIGDKDIALIVKFLETLPGRQAAP